jgi:hypothetical protein
VTVFDAFWAKLCVDSAVTAAARILRDHGAPDEATRAYASATPSVTAPTPVVFAPAPHVSRDATKTLVRRNVEARARQAHSPRAERTASSRTHSESRSVAVVYPGYAAVR